MRKGKITKSEFQLCLIITDENNEEIKCCIDTCLHLRSLIGKDILFDIEMGDSGLEVSKISL